MLLSSSLPFPSHFKVGARALCLHAPVRRTLTTRLFWAVLFWFAVLRRQVNAVRSKELTNVRAAGKDENIRLSPPLRVPLRCPCCKRGRSVCFFVAARQANWWGVWARARQARRCVPCECLAWGPFLLALLGAVLGLQMSLEEAIAYVAEDELVEVSWGAMLPGNCRAHLSHACTGMC